MDSSRTHGPTTARIIPPRRHASTLRRSRLNAKLEAAADREAIVIGGPAGSGKSTLATDWLAESGRPFCWLTLDEQLCDSRALAQYIVTAVRARYPNALRALATHLNESAGGDPREFVARFAAAVEYEIPERFVLALDDTHVVAPSEDACRLLNTLVSELPSNLLLLIITRSPTALAALPRMVVEQRARLIDDESLVFSPDEASDLLRQSGVSDASRRLRLVERAGGWAAALAVWSEDEELDAPSLAAGATAMLADFIDREVIAPLSPDQRALIEIGGVLRAFDIARLSELAGREAGPTLRALRRLAPLVLELEKPGWYRLHPLLAERAVQLLEARDPAALRELRRRAVAMLERLGEEAEALELATEAGAWPDVVALLLRGHERLLGRGAWGTVVACLDRLPADNRQREPDLLLLEARLRLQQYDASGALLRLNALDGDGLTPRQRLSVALNRARALRRLNRLGDAVVACRRAQLLARALPARDDLLTASVELELGMVQGMRGSLARSERRLRRAMVVFERHGNLGFAAQALNGIGNTLLFRGLLPEALIAFEESVRLWAALDDDSGRLSVTANKAYTQFLIGDLEAAWVTLEDALGHAHRVGDSVRAIRLEECLSTVERDLGDLEAAYARLLRAQAGAPAFDLPELRSDVTFGLGELCRERGDRVRALAHFERGLAAAARGDSELYRLPFEVRVGAVYVDDGRLEEALLILEQATRRARRLEARMEEARARFALAGARLRSGAPEAAAEELSTVVGLALRVGHDQFLVSDARQWRWLGEFAADRGIGNGFFRRLLERLPPRATVASSAPTHAPGATETGEPAASEGTRVRSESPNGITIDELREVLEHFYDDALVARTALAEAAFADAPGRPAAERTRAARALLLECIDSPALRVAPGSQRTAPVQGEILRAYYIDRLGSHEQVAEHLDLAMSTYYRNLRNGLETVAALIDARLAREATASG